MKEIFSTKRVTIEARSLRPPLDDLEQKKTGPLVCPPFGEDDESILGVS